MAQYGIKEQSGLVQWVSNEELIQRDKDEAEARSEAHQEKEEIKSLVGHIRQRFTLAVTAKQTIQDEMLRCLRQRNGVYEADLLATIEEQGDTNIYMMISDVKCRALESYLEDILLPVGEKPFELDPTPVPEVPPEVAVRAWMELGKELEAKLTQQYGMFTPDMLTPELLREEGEKLKDDLLKQLKEMADDAAKEQATQIDDDFRQGGWYDALKDFIQDLSTYPAAFIVGPIYRQQETLEWVPIPGSQLSELRVEKSIVKTYERFDPFDVYPGPSAKSVHEGDLCLRLRLRRSDLLAMKGIDGYDDATIDRVLSEHGESGFRDPIYSDTEHADLHDRPQQTQNPTGNIDAVKFYGSAQGLLLRSWGMTPDQIPNPFDDYEIVATVIGNYCIMARLNHHPLKKRNIYTASYKQKNGSVWGQCPPQLMRDIQHFCNAAARAICRNFAIASGPQVWINMERAAPGTDIQDLFPWKIWPFTNPKTHVAGSADKPMDFYQPQLVTKDLMEAYDYFFKQASEITGIPAYTSENLRGAGKTARGLAMLRNDAARGIRAVARNIDMGVIAPSVEEHRLAIWMEDHTRVKGDAKVVARASEYLIQQEQLEMRRNEMLDRTNNPTDLQIIGLGGRAELLRANARALQMDVDKIIPPKEDMVLTLVQQRIEQIVMTLAQVFGIAPEQLMAIIENPPQPDVSDVQQIPNMSKKNPGEPEEKQIEGSLEGI